MMSEDSSTIFAVTGPCQTDRQDYIRLSKGHKCGVEAAERVSGSDLHDLNGEKIDGYM